MRFKYMWQFTLNEICPAARYLINKKQHSPE
ncbi:hypothetical protein CKO_04905 [Citrobacter koseri ATCC BAA-895]|uniref:Uncharacterized protein n=1 Tax=Citrobacter koseri (strain ATCC BAA-895 / CDC 4225-83 / SGSC4696) TaxID=290338 RepID=A8AR36_CITK8|nr:hypothetical protein CKO_04905 [Citrobacter koseri ATCC BAA-895]